MYRILLVEDDSALRYVYSKMKTWVGNGFEISAEASNGKEALELLDKEEFDLVVTDIRMPFVDGLTLLSKIKERSIDVVSVLLSSYNEFEYARQGLVLGAFDYIVKPISDKNLSEVLQRAKIYLGEKNEISKIDNIVINAANDCKFSVDCGNIVNKACVYLSENLGRIVTMEEIADSFSISKDYFGKSFKKQTGATFNNFYTAVKIEYAKKLIDTSDYKNYEISDLLGYSDPDYFAKVFKSVAGVSPASYRSESHN